MDGKGFEFLKDAALLPKRCAFCRQEVGPDVPTRCARCATLYHSDCWAANGQRCAVYGCEPAEKPVPVAAAAPPEPYRLPAPSPFSLGRGGWIVLVVVIPNVIRLLASTSANHRTVAPVELPPARVERVFPIYSRAEPGRSVFFERGCFHYDLHDWKECVSDFVLAGSGDSPVRNAAQIRIFFARCRLGENEAALRVLRGHLESRLSPEDRSWEAQSLRFVAGLTPESEYLEAIPFENGSPVPERACEAYFYAGTLRLIADDEAGARACFGRCIATGIEKSREVRSARGELEALDRKR